MHKFRFAIFFAAVIAATPAFAARCGGDFHTFVAAMSTEAAAAGISQGVISQALGGVTQDPAVLAFDRRQRGTFTKTFEQYVSTRVGPGRINMGRQMLLRHGSLLSRIEQQFGVPPQIVVAIWGLESDFGKGEIGQTQFLPSSYIKYGVDFDGNGHVDLRHSVPDVLASTANLLHMSGFKGGAPYGEGTANFEAMREWNRATIYRKTIGYFADQLVGR